MPPRISAPGAVRPPSGSCGVPFVVADGSAVAGIMSSRREVAASSLSNTVSGRTGLRGVALCRTRCWQQQHSISAAKGYGEAIVPLDERGQIVHGVGHYD